MLSSLIIAGFALVSAPPDEGSGLTIILQSDQEARLCFLRVRSEDFGDEALEICTAAIEDETTSPFNLRASYANRGVILYNRGDYKGSLGDFTVSIELSRRPRSVIYSNRGLCYEQIARGRPAIDALARADYLKALERDPENDVAASRILELEKPYPMRRRLSTIMLAGEPVEAPSIEG